MSGLAVVVSIVFGLGFWVYGSLLATRFTNSSYPARPDEELKGAIVFLFGTFLMISVPATIARFRPTAFWKWAALVTAVIVGGLTLVVFGGWPPESSWTVY